MALDRIDVLVDQKPFTWKLVNSLWIAPIIIGMGLFSLIGWLWAGILARSPKVWRIVTVWGVVVALSFISIALGDDKDSAWKTLGGTLFIISWFGSFAHALIIRGTVLREIVSREDELARLRALYGTHQVPSRSTTARAPVDDRLSQRIPSHNPLPPELEVDTSQYYEQSPPRTAWAPPLPGTSTRPATTPPRTAWAPPSSTPAESRPSSAPAVSTPAPPSSAIPSEPALVDVNTAPSAVLLALPALDQAAVERIVAAREERGGFHDLNDLTSAAALQPHQLVALQDRVSFSRFRRPGTQVHGRILDL